MQPEAREFPLFLAPVFQVIFGWFVFRVFHVKQFSVVPQDSVLYGRCFAPVRNVEKVEQFLVFHVKQQTSAAAPGEQPARSPGSGSAEAGEAGKTCGPDCGLPDPEEKTAAVLQDGGTRRPAYHLEAALGMTMVSVMASSLSSRPQEAEIPERRMTSML